MKIILLLLLYLHKKAFSIFKYEEKLFKIYLIKTI